MPACVNCHQRDAAPWDADSFCPRCRAQIARTAALAAARRRAIAGDRRTPALPGLGLPTATQPHP